jgi:hypothetical protein
MSLVLFEWKLIIRNKRLKQQFFAMLLILLVFCIQIATNSLVKETFLIREFFLWTAFSISAHLATYTFGINTTFIEKQLTIPLPISKILQAKYKFFFRVSTVFFILYLSSTFLGTKVFEIIAAFLFAVGFGFCGLFCTSLFSYKPFDIKASNFANYQGNDVGSILTPFLVLAVAFGFMAFFHWIFNENVVLIAMSVIGLLFIVTHKIWLKFIADRFGKNKYYRLERFRKK